MKEVDFQSRLVEAARARGGFAFKMSNRFLVGVLDLFIKLPGHPTVILECKMGDQRNGTARSVDLTPKQRKTIRDAHKGGQAAGWAVACPANKHAGLPGSWCLTFGAGPDTVVPDETCTVQWRNKGEPWPIEEIVRAIEHVTG